MFRTIALEAGSLPGEPGLILEPAPITIFVGPNGSGKSKVLQELLAICRGSGPSQAQFSIIRNVEFAGRSESEARAELDSITLPILPGENIGVGFVPVGTSGFRMHIVADQLVRIIANPQISPSLYAQQFLTMKTLMLDGPGRIGLVNQQSGGDLQQSPQSSFQVLLKDDAKRFEVRRVLYSAFGRYFVIDPTQLGSLRVRMSERAPSLVTEEIGIHDDAIKFHAASEPIEISSDGVKAYTGIITSVIAGDPSVLLIDEPEAFLHPPLASSLGYELSRAAVSSQKRVFVSTHSAAFVMGCIQSGVPVSIVRLTYRNKIATARALKSENLVPLMRNPLLRSTGLLAGLFYENVVVTESDADRAFYQEVNERLMRDKPEWGIPNCLFLHAQNKQTIHTIVRPLRALGIPVASITDIDTIKEGGVTWTRHLSAASVPQGVIAALNGLRQTVKIALEQTGRNMKRDGGAALLIGEDLAACENLMKQLAEYGLFLVPGGELESWLRPLGAAGHGPGWLVDVFQRMGDVGDDGHYVKPGNGDVWSFMSEIRQWLLNPRRLGIPVSSVDLASSLVV